ncbi:chemotaxis protein CheD [Couchioplanes caeruleus]|uniref:chemotaxis protein CheD n=1 Tax=Couchioplanes caeruleus TaxID=56438 RepID=UPI0020BD8797|nr:chemotaxis protein CheD [Couchioplanes caeruleus]UQU67906.1 chemotaxis protein CheD [Couchioplanes caeruleus]
MADTDVHLNPGDFRFAGGDVRLHTLLGSCVAITLWHPGRRIGGMCHYLLPGRHPGVAPRLDGRYADDAVGLFHREVDRHGTTPQDYVVKVFGGADQFPRIPGPLTGVAAQNARVGLDLLRRHGFTVSACELGGRGSRRLIFELATGDVWLRSLDPYEDRATT